MIKNIIIVVLTFLLLTTSVYSSLMSQYTKEETQRTETLLKEAIKRAETQAAFAEEQTAKALIREQKLKKVLEECGKE